MKEVPERRPAQTRLGGAKARSDTQHDKGQFTAPEAVDGRA